MALDLFRYRICSPTYLGNPWLYALQCTAVRVRCFLLDSCVRKLSRMGAAWAMGIGRNAVCKCGTLRCHSVRFVWHSTSREKRKQAALTTDSNNRILDPTIAYDDAGDMTRDQLRMIHLRWLGKADRGEWRHLHLRRRRQPHQGERRELDGVHLVWGQLLAEHNPATEAQTDYRGAWRALLGSFDHAMSLDELPLSCGRTRAVSGP